MTSIKVSGVSPTATTDASLQLPLISGVSATVISEDSSQSSDFDAFSSWGRPDPPIVSFDDVPSSNMLDTPYFVLEHVAAGGISMQEFVEGVQSVFSSLATKQEPLDPKVDAIWQEHLNDLYMP